MPRQTGFAMKTALFAVLLLIGVGMTGLRADDEKAKGLDPFLPADTESYISINVRQILDAPVIKKEVLGPLKEMMKEVADLDDLAEAIGFDPFKNLDRVIVAGSAGTETDRGLIVAYGKFDPEKLTKKLGDLAKDSEETVSAHKVALGAGATHTVWEVAVPGAEKKIFTAIVDEKTVIVSPGKDYVVDALKQHKAKKAPALKNKTFQALLEKLDAKQSLSLAMVGKNLDAGDDPVLKFVADAMAGVEAIGGGITVGTEVKFDLLVAGKSEPDAKVVRETLDKGVRFGLVGLALLEENQKGLGALLEVLKTVKIGGRGKVVTVTAKLTADVLEEFFKKD